MTRSSKADDILDHRSAADRLAVYVNQHRPKSSELWCRRFEPLSGNEGHKTVEHEELTISASVRDLEMSLVIGDVKRQHDRARLGEGGLRPRDRDYGCPELARRFCAVDKGSRLARNGKD